MRWIVGTLLAIWLLARFTSISTAWLDHPFPRTGSEGRILYETLLTKHGTNIYDPITPE